MFTFRLRLLSPLFYRTKQDAGAAGSTITSAWIGDLALSYAINKALGVKDFKFGYKSHKPDYSELMELPFIPSVAVPVKSVERTQVYDIATNFISEGYSNTKAIKKSQNAPFRNWLKRQGLAPGNEFRFVLAVKDGWEPPNKFTIRLGNTLECIGVCEIESEKLEKITTNAYALKTLFGVESEGDLEFGAVEKPMAQYILLHDVDISHWLSLISPYS